GEHAFHADRRRQDHLGSRRALRLVRGRGCLADGADARQRTGRRRGRHAVLGLLPACGGRPRSQDELTFPVRPRTDVTEDPAMSNAPARLRFRWVVTALQPAAVTQAQPTWGNPSPTAGGETSQKANAAADQTIYQPVTYTNAAKKGPALIVIPGEIKSNNATF